MKGDYYPITPLPEDSIFKKAGEDLTYQLKDKEIGNFVGREKELSLVMKILGWRKKGNPMIIGEAGVGKTFLVKCLAYKIVKKDVPRWLFGKKIIKTSYDDIMATLDTTSNWKWPEYIKKLKQVIEETVNKPIILFIDEIHRIFDYSESTNILKPYLAEGRLKLIGATTTQEYLRFIERNEAVARRFQVVKLPEPQGDVLKTILKEEKVELEKTYPINIPEEIIDEVIKLSSEYLPYRFQPDKSIDILEQVAIECCATKKEEVKEEDVRKTVSELTGIPDESLKSEKEKVSGLEQALNLKILGQEEAIKRIAERLTVTRNKVQINPERPLGVFLFAGPSGVGKTELAKALAGHFTGSEENLIRVDMSIYKTVYSLNSLLGRPGSVVTTQRDASATEYPYLTSRIRRNPFSVLLLDEIDKADPEVWTIFLQAFDYGQMTDYEGNKIFFNTVIVVMTCNVGLEHTIKTEPMGFSSSDANNWGNTESDIKKAIERTFPKEFLGRIDDILIFRPLTEKVIEGFIKQKIERLKRQIGKEILLKKEVIELIKKVGFDKKYGARPLNRAVDNVIGKALAELKMASDWDKIKSIKIELKENKVRATAVLKSG